MDSREMTGLYVHLPFCPRRCGYCDFAVVVGREPEAEAYAEALSAEVGWLARTTGRPRLESLYFGGGTPTRTPAAVLRVLAAVRAAFAVADDAEVTVEANPESATEETLDRLRAAGVNRLSLGVQSFDDGCLRRLGRSHDAAAAGAAVQRARERFPEVSVDLMFGVPGTSAKSWRRDLERAVALGPDHVSTYCLTVEEHTPLARAIRRGEAPPSEDALEAAHMALAAAFLPACGYARYEISNYARPGRASRHNLRYWRNQSCLGAGVAAAAFWAGTRWTNTADFDAYLARAAGRPAALFPPGPAADFHEHLPPRAALGESILVGLRLLEGVDLGALSARHGVSAEETFGAAIRAEIEQGLLERRGDRIALTARGLRFANRVLMAFALPGEGVRQSPRAS
ncbi:MAG: radical SAM family heme chaperone HemW [Planctomycetes bacterium]|nr:radical SAM family heme chaperone HemW [Planctomycetota bacterium]